MSGKGALILGSDIERYLPHREPVLMVQEILEETDDGLTASALLGKDFPFQDAQGFVYDSVWCELAAQASAVFLKRRSEDPDEMGLLTGINDFRIHRATALPAEVSVRIAFSRRIGQVFVFWGEVRLAGGIPVAEGELVFFVQPSEESPKD